MKQGQLKLTLALIFVFIMAILLVYAVTTVLISPTDNSVDTDGYLDLRSSCAPSTFDGTTSWNVTNATLYTNVNGSWALNNTLKAVNPLSNSTEYFNFTNRVNSTREGTFLWNVECEEQNGTISSGAAGLQINKAFAGNFTIRVDFADATLTATNPPDQTYSFDGFSVPFICTASPSGGWNLSNISLYTNEGGVWQIAQNISDRREPGQIVGNFTHNFTSTDNGTAVNIKWACAAVQVRNQSSSGAEPLITSRIFTTNRTLLIEAPPDIDLNGPPNLNWSQNRQVKLSFTFSSTHAHPASSPFNARIWSNESGVWMPVTGVMSAANNTQISQDFTFPEKTNILWGVQAYDANDVNAINHSVNRTINIDTINPTVVLTTQNQTQDSSVQILLTPTDMNLAAVVIKFNNFTQNNYSNTSPISGVQIILDIDGTLTDGKYNFSVFANDSSGRQFQSSNFTLTIDTIASNVTNFVNLSIESACDQRNLTWDTNEPTNHTFYFDTDTNVADGTIITSSVNETNHSVIFDFNFNGEIDYYFNITSCDQAGNCNTSNQRTFTTPARVCNGWTQYGVNDARINLSSLQNQSGADLVYVWNATAQDWILFTAGLSSNAAVEIGLSTKYHVVHLSENTNSTWFRNTSYGFYEYNVSAVNNFISIFRHYNFGNLTETFMNATKFPSFIGNDTSDVVGSLGETYGPFNISFFAGYNNSLQDYTSHVFNFTWANLTIIEPCVNRTILNTCMESIWVASAFNITWNGTGITANWSARR